jgi:branched-chain amino acid transport system substrate-binding protein
VKYISLNRAMMLCMGVMLAACSSEQQATQSPSPLGKSMSAHQRAQKNKGAKTATSKQKLPEVKVAILLPLTGDASQLGNALLDSAMMGLFDKDASTPASEKRRQVVLLPKDTEHSPAVAAKRAQEALDEGAQLIIGPLFSEDVKTVAPLAKARGISVLSFSNNKTVGQNGIFLLGFMPEQQAKRVVSEAITRGKQRIAILAPDNDYGHMVAAASQAEATNKGMKIHGEAFYDNTEGTVDIAIQRILGGRTADASTKPDAIVIAEGGESLNRILATFKNFGVTSQNMAFLGTGLWDDDSMKSRPDLQDAWFASAPLASRKGFDSRFKKSYGYSPLRLASLSYDAVALAATLANNPQGVDFSATAFTNPNGYYGPANGIFRCRVDGICERGLSVLKITPNGFSEQAPSPRSFAGY